MMSAQPQTNDEMKDTLHDKAKLDELHKKWIVANPGASTVRESFEKSVQLKKERSNRSGGGSSSRNGGGGGGMSDVLMQAEQAEFERDQRDLEMMAKEAELEKLELEFSWDRFPKQLKLFGSILILDLKTLNNNMFDGGEEEDVEMGIEEEEDGRKGKGNRGEGDQSGPQTKRARHR